MNISENTRAACREVFKGKGNLSIKIDEEAGRCQAAAAKASKEDDVIGLHAALVALASVITVLSARHGLKLGLQSAVKWKHENMKYLDAAIEAVLVDVISVEQE